MARRYLGGGPKGKQGFPIGDPVHDKMAISGATRSANVGNISRADAKRKQAAARADLRRLEPNKPHTFK
jgi:hypothetical protein